MKILVTGGAGFIASHVTDRYLQLGHEVAVVDNLSTGFRENINKDAIFYEEDIRKFDAIDKIFKDFKPDIVNHHAAQMDVRKSVEDPVYDAECNILASLNLIIKAVEYNVKRFIYISTGGAVYGEPKELPVKETHPINPECQYGISKHTVEHYLYLYKLLYGLDYVVLRYPNVYGPRQNPMGEAGVVAIFCGKMLKNEQPVIFGDGEQLRDYVYIDDVVEANVLALNKGSGIYNIGSGIGSSVNFIYRILADELGYKNKPVYDRPRKGEIYKIYLNADLAKKELGWSYKVKFEEGLRRTARWFKERLSS